MFIEQLRVDTIKDIITNVYIVISEGSAMVIDPGGEPEKIINKLDELNVNLKYIVITHCHSDHIGAITELQKAKGGEVLASNDDGRMINNPIRNLSPFVGIKLDKINVNKFLNEGDKIVLGNETFEIIETPGHTKGGICIYCPKQNVLFSGDTIFKGTYGRTDLPSSSYKDIKNSISKLMKLPNETKVYPGHGEPTTIEHEKQIYE